MNAMNLLALLACNQRPDAYAKAGVMEDLRDGIGGPKALARPGDIVLENDRIKVAVTTAHNSMGPSLFGGSVIDADLNRVGAQYTGGRGNDRLAEIFPTVNMNVPKADGVDPDTESWSETLAAQQVQILSEGSETEPAIVRVTAPSEPFLRLLAGLWVLVDAPDFTLQTDYILEPGQSWLTMRTTAAFTADETVPEDPELLSYEPGMELLDLALESGVTFGDFYLQGGSVNVFAPGLGFWEDGAVYEARDAGLNTFTSPFELDFVAGTADGVSYGLASLSGPVSVPLFTSSQTAAFGVGKTGDPDAGEDRFTEGSAYTYERIFVIGDGDVGSVLDGILEARGVPTGRVDGHVYSEGRAEPLSGVSVLVFEPGAEAPFSQWETDVSWTDTVPDGSFGGTLPVGEWELQVHDGAHGTGDRIAITVTEGGQVDVNPTLPLSGSLSLELIDETGMRVPGKVTLFPADGQGVVRDPVLGDGYIAGDPEAVVFMPYGQKEVSLPPGDYVAYATRGMEYELDVAEISVTSGGQTDAILQVTRSVDTSGWISADFHVHAVASHDSGVSLHDRIATMASEQVEFLISSDHDYVADYRPVIQDMGMEPWISSAVGLEVTTVEVGHYIGFPVEHDYLADGGGAFDWTGETPSQMLNDLRSLGDGRIEPVTMVAHPRDGILGYFDQMGFSPYGGNPGAPVVDDGILKITNPLTNSENFTLNFDALELMNGKRYDFLRTPTQAELDAYAADGSTTAYDIIERSLAEQEMLDAGVDDDGEIFQLGYGIHGQIDDWFTLLNLGYQLTALGNSDTHGTSSTESGCPRNFVASSTDDPAYVDAVEIAQAVRDGHVFTSYGPFLRFTADEGQVLMGDTLDAASIELELEVQSPTWFDVERVELYRNGELIEVFEIETPNADVLNLVEFYEDAPDQDSWYVMIAMGSGSLEPLFTPVLYEPVQLQEVVTEALGGVEALSGLLEPMPPAPRTQPVHPYAISNPIYLNVDGGEWTAPGVPEFMSERPEDLSAEE